MYLKRIFIKDIGPIEKLDVKAEFKSDGNPKPLIIVGENGSGKSIVLSYIADFILELQKRAFPDDKSLSESQFKTLSILNKKLDSKDHKTIGYVKIGEYEYLEPVGITNKEDLEKAGLNDINDINLGIIEYIKNISYISDNQKEELWKLFNSSAYCYFPPNRYELPHWHPNLDKQTLFYYPIQEDNPRYLNNPFIIESAQKDISSWIFSLMNLNITKNHINHINKVLNKIVKQDLKVQEGLIPFLLINAKDKLPSLKHLSTGQAVLFSLFCTIIKYGLYTTTEEMQGIVIIDEIDLHLHSDLQKEVLPELIALFPKIQFIITTHSPLFLLGIEEKFGAENISIIEMSSGDKITAERFKEFEKAFDYFKNTKKFEEDISKFKEDDIVIFIEGKTDKTILENALQKLEYSMEKKIEFYNAEGAGNIKIFFNHSNLILFCKTRILIAIFDFDEEGCKQFNKLNTENWNDWNNKEFVKKYKNGNAFAFLLPVPEFRKKDVNEKLDYKSNITIELLFEDDKIGNKGDIRECIKKFTGNKDKFAESTKDFTKEDFEHFEHIFSLISKIKNSVLKSG